MSKPRKKPSAYQRIVRAAKKGAGLLLCPDEVRRLAKDDAIMKVAAQDDAGGKDVSCMVERIEDLKCGQGPCYGDGGECRRCVRYLGSDADESVQAQRGSR